MYHPSADFMEFEYPTYEYINEQKQPFYVSGASVSQNRYRFNILLSNGDQS